MDRKSEVFLNLINTFIYQVETGESYAQTPGISLDDIEYIGFTLVIGAGDSGTYHCHAYGYEADEKSHIMVLNAASLLGKIKEFAQTTSDNGALPWKTCIIEIPENLDASSADFLYGRDAESWISPSLKIAEFVRPGTNADKDTAWNKMIYKALHGVDRTEALPKRRYVGAIEEVVSLPPSIEAELDDTMSSAIEELFSTDSNFNPVYNTPENIFQEPAPQPSYVDSKPFMDDYGTDAPNVESALLQGQPDALPVMVETVPQSQKQSLPDSGKGKAASGLFRKGGESKPKWGLGRKKRDEEEHHEEIEPVDVIEAVETPVEPPKPKRPVHIPKTIPKDEILPSFILYSIKELQEKGVYASKASIIIYLQPPVITSYGFWYSDNEHGHWMPEGYDLDDTMDAFLRDTIPDPKDPWDVCIVRMDLLEEKITTEFIKGRQAYPWMEAMSHRSKALSGVAKYTSF